MPGLPLAFRPEVYPDYQGTFGVSEKIGGIMLGAIGSTIGKIFGTDKAVSSLIDNTSSALDKLVYTKEEQAEDKAKATSEARGMVISWMQATSGQNLARRVIALVVTGLWTLNYVCINILSIVAVWVEDPEKLLASAKVISENCDQVTSAMMLVLAFYFSAPFMGDIAKGALSRFKKAT